MAGVIGFDEASRYAEAVMRAFGEVGFPPAGIELEAESPELAFTKREMLFQTQALQAAVIGQQSEVGFRNKSTPTAPRIVVITAIAIDKAAAGTGVIIGVMTTGPAGVEGISAKARDSRWPGTTNPPGRTTGVSVTNSEVASSITSDAIFAAFPLSTAALNIQQLPAQVLGPGATFWVVDATANEGMRVTFWGYERVARPEEVAV